MSAAAFAQLDSERYWAFGGLVHEVKHVSSLYKRVRHSLGVAGESDPDFHPTWIEEGTAEIAQGNEFAPRVGGRRGTGGERPGDRRGARGGDHRVVSGSVRGSST